MNAPEVTIPKLYEFACTLPDEEMVNTGDPAT